MNAQNRQQAAAPGTDAIAIHLLRALTRCALEGRRTDFEELAREIGVRRADARRVLTMLDHQGYVNVLTMRPTLAGFAAGKLSSSTPLPSLRPARAKIPQARGSETRAVSPAAAAGLSSVSVRAA